MILRGGGMGFFFMVAVLGLAFLVLTVYAAIRAAQNGDVGWLLGIVFGWLLGLGWVFAVVYVAAIDPGRRRPVLAPGSLPPPSSAPAGWFPDPTGRHEARYWDGARWTEHVTDQGRPGTDPV